jgi:FkbM family methyltransferase
MIFKKIAREISAPFRRFYKRSVIKDPFTIEVTRWFKDKGDTTLRLDYPLTKDSVVFDVGGYVGDYANDIFNKYECRVFVFEPHPKFYNECLVRFKDNAKVSVYNFGIADVDGEFALSDSDDASSFLTERQSEVGDVTCKMREFFSVLAELDITKIDLMKINIEGGEYPLMQYIADQKKLSVVDNYQIQFHDFAQDAVARRNSIVSALEKTHQRTWCYEFVWENWKLL